MTQQETQSVITDEMRAVVGKEGEPSTLEVDKTGCRMFARAVGHTDLIYYDEEYAKSKGYRSIVAPPGFLGTRTFKPAGDVLTARNKVTGFNERSGSMGPMLITSRETTYTDQDGKVVAVERGTVIQY